MAWHCGGAECPAEHCNCVCIPCLEARVDELQTERDEAIRLRESDSKSLEWTWGEVRKVAEALGLDGKATVPALVDAARAAVLARDAWATQCNIASEAHSDAVHRNSVLRAAIESITSEIETNLAVRDAKGMSVPSDWDQCPPSVMRRIARALRAALSL